eukprot:4805169-Pleurochrysis_carterae.AAC.1
MITAEAVDSRLSFSLSACRTTRLGKSSIPVHACLRSGLEDSNGVAAMASLARRSPIDAPDCEKHVIIRTQDLEMPE